MAKLLLHICCGVCALGIVKKLKQDGIQITGYFYNPNIHPFMEFLKRLRAVEVMAEQDKLTILYERDYGLDAYLNYVAPHAKSYDTARCEKCYEMRLTQTARKARELGFDSFTSTLIISPQQNQAVIKNMGEKIAKDHGIIFKYDSIDWQSRFSGILPSIGGSNLLKQNCRPITDLYQECKEMAKKRNLYRQQYCGCVFSEYERYHHKND